MKDNKFDLSYLSDGIPQMPRRLTSRERISDQVYFFLQLSSRFVFIAGGIVGYAAWGGIGGVVLTLSGFLFGLWMRHSLGVRGPDQFHGFFNRMKERANGSRRGLLEWVIESIRGSGFTPTKCKSIAAAYELAMSQLSSTTSPGQQRAILQQLDVEVKRISYSI